MPRIAPGHRCCWLIRLPGCSMNRRRGRSRAGRAHPLLPHVDGVQSTDFSHTVEFSRSLVGMLLRLPCGSRSGPVARAAATVPRAFQVRQPSDLSPLSCPRGSHRFALAARERGRHRSNGASPPGIPRGPSHLPYPLSASSRHRGDGSLRSRVVSTVGLPQSHYLGPLAPPRHQHFIQKSRPAPCSSWASGRPPPAVGSRSYWLSVTSCLSVLVPSWRRRRGLGPRRTSLSWCAVKVAPPSTACQLRIPAAATG
jgi:hypothetical protein